MTRLRDIDNCRTSTGRSVTADGGRRFATTFRTTLDLSQCVLNGVVGASAEYGEGRSAALPQSADRVRHSTTQYPNALVKRVAPVLVDPACHRSYCGDQHSDPLRVGRAAVGRRSAVAYREDAG